MFSTRRLLVIFPSHSYTTHPSPPPICHWYTDVHPKHFSSAAFVFLGLLFETTSHIHRWPLAQILRYPIIPTHTHCCPRIVAYSKHFSKLWNCIEYRWTYKNNIIRYLAYIFVIIFRLPSINVTLNVKMLYIYIYIKDISTHRHIYKDTPLVIYIYRYIDIWILYTETFTPKSTCWDCRVVLFLDRLYYLNTL